MSVRKRTWKNADGTTGTAWLCDYTDAAGHRRSRSFKLKRAADAFAATTSVEVAQGIHVPDGATVTVREAADLWLKSCADAGREQSTLAQYRQHVKLHIVPMLGATKLNRINVPGVRTFQERLRDEKRSPAMVKRVTVSLGAILGDAQERGLVVRNAVSEMSRRRGSSAAKAEKRQKGRLRYGVDIPTMEEARAVVAAAEGRYRPFMIMAIFSGMRASELRGLSWADVDLRKAVVHVRQRADAYRVIGMPKSDAGQRTIPIPPLVVETLREWRSSCPAGELGLVFPSGTGKVEYHANIINRGLHPIVLRAGLGVETGERDAEGKQVLAPKYSGLHAWRHWFASWCINSKDAGGLGLLPKAVQARMGHSSIQQTLDVYGHLWPAADEAQALAEAQARFFDGASMAQQSAP